VFELWAGHASPFASLRVGGADEGVRPYTIKNYYKKQNSRSKIQTLSETQQ